MWDMAWIGCDGTTMNEYAREVQEMLDGVHGKARPRPRIRALSLRGTSLSRGGFRAKGDNEEVSRTHP